MKLAILGSRSFNDYPALLEIVKALKPTMILSCKEKDEESLAEKAADELKIRKITFVVDNNRHEMIQRNHAIIDSADEILVFWNGTSIGTFNAIDYAERVGKHCTIKNFKTT
jgi:hypothetical protein